jgi:hypothetical protein
VHGTVIRTNLVGPSRAGLNLDCKPIQVAISKASGRWIDAFGGALPAQSKLNTQSVEIRDNRRS